MDNSKRLSAICARIEAATPGPWEQTHEPGSHQVYGAEPKGGVTSGEWICECATTIDQDFIAHARSDVPWLLEQVERLQAFYDDENLEMIQTQRQLEHAHSYIARLEAAHVEALKELHSHLLHGSYPCPELEYTEKQFVDAEMQKLKEGK